MNLQNVYKPLDKPEDFAKRITSNFPSVYLTIISIIQGVSLGILATKTFDYQSTTSSIGIWLYSLNSFMILIVISYCYTWFTGVFRWSPKVWDTLIPFIVGFIEVAAIFHLKDPPQWWLWTAVLCFCGAIAFVNSILNCKSDMFGKKSEVYRAVRVELIGNVIVSIVAGLICIYVWILYNQNYICITIEIWALTTLFFSSIALLIKGERFLTKVHSIFGYKR